MTVLVDSSVWVAHFKQRDKTLVSLLSRDQVLTHPMILGELACGTPPAPRNKTLGDLRLLRQCHCASWDEAMGFIEREALYGLGCGWVDVTLLASALMTPTARLWTLDKRLAKLAKHFNIQFVK